ncbi:MAG: BCD family MFS transporter [Anaerolineae bacterium]|nr:BCD family MFS transporter [Anaerolineae bacterium]
MVRRLNIARMIAFPLGLGLLGVLVSGTLNRVMIVELAMPASLVGLFFAVPFLLSPLRMWLGYRSDGWPIFGLRREPYIVLGAALGGLGVVGATLLALSTDDLGLLVVLALLLAFIAYGVGKNLASNTFEALLADKFEGHARARAVTLFKIPMFLGIIGGSIMLGRALDPFTVGRFTSIVLGVAALMAILAGFAVMRQEPRGQSVQAAEMQARRESFREVFGRFLWRDPQARLFFIFVMLTLTGTQAQDVLLEPYGALALNMTVAQTTRLNSIWGTGVILTMALAGGWLIQRAGYRRILQVGLLLNIGVFAGIILSGVVGSAGMFQGFVFLLGVGTGFAAAGAFAAVVDFTTFTRAGFLMGVWGVAEQFGTAIGNLFGGVIVDGIRTVTGNPLAAYGTVFALEGALLIGALVLLSRIDVRASVALNEEVQAEQDTRDAVGASAAVPEFAG